jgi:hypothetical protein
MAISTIGSVFAYSTTESGTYTNIDITSFPDLVGTPESIDVTTMSDSAYCSIPGVKGSNGASDFSANYDAAVYSAINKLTGEVYQKLTFSDGSGFKWKGELTVSNAEGAVNGKIGMTIHAFKSTEPEFFTTSSSK